jgi:predicted O-linked N-acetylglucosamine transferase (SPINDLY family)
MNAALAVEPSWDAIAEGRAALAAGDPARAAGLFRQLAAANRTDTESRYWLFSALIASGHDQAAGLALAEARELHAVAVMQSVGVDMGRLQTDRAYSADIGRQLYGAHLMAAASLALGSALDLQNLEPQLMISYGLSLQHQGRIDEAVDVFTAAAEVFQHPHIHEFLLFPLFHVDDRLRRVSDEARKWARLYAPPPALSKAPFGNERNADRRLRIGYVGPSFARNQLAQFLIPVLEAHDADAVEIFLYCADARNEGEPPGPWTVKTIGGVPDEQVAAQIRADRIDILVDVWGHTAGSRLSVFAHKPAPIQVAWINFVQTTGLDCMDYVLHADSMAVPGTADYFTETVWPIGPIVAPSRPAAERPDPVATPAIKTGFVTFGSFNNPAKLSAPTVAAWSRILSARPRDRLVLKYSYYADPVLQRVTQARFAAHGAQPEQVVFRGHSTGQDYWRAFQEIDLALDPSPCPGGTTTCDALANGVPVLTQWGEDFFSRIGVPVVLPCGLPELIADGWDDYVAKALSLTADVAALDALRAKVRPGFDASPYRDEVGFTRNLEGVYREMYARWLEAPA